MLNTETLLRQFDPVAGTMPGATIVKRHLSDLRGCFADTATFETALRAGDPLIYTVASAEPASGEGDLHYGIGRLMPGRIGNEYFMTKGHLHSWREAAEIYLGLTGEGVMLLENEATGESRMVPLRPHHAVYIPGHAAHRTINVGTTPLTYLGVYPAKAGHDYGAIAQRNFRCVVVEREGRPAMIEREKLT